MHLSKACYRLVHKYLFETLVWIPHQEILFNSSKRKVWYSWHILNLQQNERQLYRTRKQHCLIITLCPNGWKKFKKTNIGEYSNQLNKKGRPILITSVVNLITMPNIAGLVNNSEMGNHVSPPKKLQYLERNHSRNMCILRTRWTYQQKVYY